MKIDDGELLIKEINSEYEKYILFKETEYNLIQKQQSAIKVR